MDEGEGAGAKDSLLHAPQQLPPTQEIPTGLFEQSLLGAMPRFTSSNSHGISSVNAGIFSQFAGQRFPLLNRCATDSPVISATHGAGSKA